MMLDFDCEQVEQQTSQTELKHWLSEITPLVNKYDNGGTKSKDC